MMLKTLYDHITPKDKMRKMEYHYKRCNMWI